MSWPPNRSGRASTHLGRAKAASSDIVVIGHSLRTDEALLKVCGQGAMWAAKMGSSLQGRVPYRLHRYTTAPILTALPPSPLVHQYE